LPVGVVVGVGQLVGVVVGVVGVTVVADQGIEIEIGDPAGDVVAEIVIGKRGLVLQMRQVGQAAEVVEDVVGVRDQTGAGEVGVAVDLVELACRVEEEVDVFVGHRVAARLILLLDRIDPAEVVVDIIGDEVVGTADVGRKLRAAARDVEDPGEGDHGRQPRNDQSC